MAMQGMNKKRKSTEASDGVMKKVKVVKSGEKSAPLRSALKKPTTETHEKIMDTKPANKSKVIAAVSKAKSQNGKILERTETSILEDEEDGGTQLTADQTAALLAGFSSSEDEADSDAEAGVALSSIPKAPSAAAIQKRVKQAISSQSDPETTPGVVYVGRVPHGFFEPQMKAYFSQFGDIINLRLARNKKTGRSQHHAFIEFASGAVADIVAKTMDKYLLFGHILQVRRVPKELVKEGMFKGRSGRKKPPPRGRFEARKLMQGATRDVWEKRVEMEKKRREEKAEKLKELGYVFEMPAVKGVHEVPVRKVDMEMVLLNVDADADLEAVKDAEPPSKVFLNDVKNANIGTAESVVTDTVVTKKRPASGKSHAKRGTKKVKV